METKELVEFFERIGFIENERGIYVGNEKGTSDKTPIHINFLSDQRIICFKGVEELFTVLKGIKLGTLLVLSQQFRLIHKRFIYEMVDAIEETFEEYED